MIDNIVYQRLKMAAWYYLLIDVCRYNIPLFGFMQCNLRGNQVGILLCVHLKPRTEIELLDPTLAEHRQNNYAAKASYVLI